MPVTKKTKTTNRRVVKPAVAVKRPMIDPISAIKNFWLGYFNFTGRSTRAEYWFGIIFMIVVNFLFMYFYGFGLLSRIVWAVLFIPGMALTVRRFRDAGISVWLYLVPLLLVYLIPIIRWSDWVGFIESDYASSGMLIYYFFTLAFAIFTLVVACIPSKK